MCVWRGKLWDGCGDGVEVGGGGMVCVDLVWVWCLLLKVWC